MAPSYLRHRFVIAGIMLAVALGFGAPALARAVPLRPVAPDALLVAMLALAFTSLGYAVARHIDTLTLGALEDPVTRVGNRRHWECRMREELERAVRSRMPLTLLLVDVDHLKALNDANGHLIGDRALELVGEVLRATCRSRDVAARFGGDEFAVLLPRTRASEAEVVAARIRSELVRRRREVGKPFDNDLTVSMGIADLEAIPEPRAHLLFEAADRTLYAAKSAGRDRVEVCAPWAAAVAPRAPGQTQTSQITSSPPPRTAGISA